jgi:hypothetical protein
MIRRICLLVWLGSIIGCAGSSHVVEPPPSTQPATAVDPATTQPSYWLARPAPVTIQCPDFETLWNTCTDAARDFLFVIDRTDYRAGVMTTKPLTSSQWIEFWRPEVRTIDDSAQSSLAAIRRTIHFEFTKLADGSYEVAPKVLVEREAIAEQRITSVTGYRGVFTRPRNSRDIPRGTKEFDVGVQLPSRYWYVVGRDEAMEKALADSIEKKLKNPSDTASAAPADSG